MLVVAGTQTTVELKQQRAKAERQGFGASTRELLLQEGHNFQPGNWLLLLGKSIARAAQPHAKVAWLGHGTSSHVAKGTVRLVPVFKDAEHWAGGSKLAGGSEERQGSQQRALSVPARLQMLLMPPQAR